MSPAALAIFMHHDWPGNVRELENAIEHAFILCPAGLIQPQHLPGHLRSDQQPGPPLIGLTLEELEKRALWEALERHQWRNPAKGGTSWPCLANYWQNLDFLPVDNLVLCFIVVPPHEKPRPGKGVTISRPAPGRLI